MKKLFVLAEGQTKETFVREVLAPHLYDFGVAPVPVLLTTKRTKTGLTFKGGVTKYSRARDDILRLLRDSSAVAVTTMVDYYGLPTDFPGHDTCPAGTPYARVTYMQKLWAADIDNPRFLPFLTLHEFEALLFVNVAAIAAALPDYPVTKALTQIRKQVTSPEEIDDGPMTHPSAHILRYAPAYQKLVDGPLITRTIGLAGIRAECPHFDAWIVSLEQLSMS